MFCCSFTYFIFSFFLLISFLFLFFFNQKKVKKLTNLTKYFLLSKDKIENECKQISIALKNAPIVKNEKEVCFFLSSFLFFYFTYFAFLFLYSVLNNLEKLLNYVILNIKHLKLIQNIYYVLIDIFVILIMEH